MKYSKSLIVKAVISLICVNVGIVNLLESNYLAAIGWVLVATFFQPLEK